VWKEEMLQEPETGPQLIIDFPAPVSPESIFDPPEKLTDRASIIAKSLIAR
jgi:hypothetical protein